MIQKVPPVAGRFVWHDMMTTDLETSVRFYTSLFGWTTQRVEMGGETGTYTMIQVGEKSIGGFVPLDKSQGAPSHWIGYLTTDDIDRCVARVESLGGKVHVPVTEIPDTGRFAVIADPTGAVVSAFQHAGDPTPEPTEPPGGGEFCWNELLTDDPKKAAAFFGELVGWTSEEMDMGALGTYYVQKRGEADAAGMMQMPPGVQAPPSWLPYISVSDVDATTVKAKGLDAQVLHDPTDIPKIGRFAVLQDPAGAVLAIFKAACS